MSNSERSLTVVQPPSDDYALVPMVNIDAVKAHLDNFRKFIDEVLEEERGHFGKMPGVNRDFLQQPGAEVLAHALEARVDYEILTEDVDREQEYCRFVVKAKLVNMHNGIVLGTADGACSSDEYARNCPVKRAKSGGEDVLIDCPIHGPRQIAKEWRDRDAGGKATLQCPRKIQQPLANTLQNVLAKAEKRAFVKAVRTVGCVSERFTQDDDLVRQGSRQRQGQPTGRGTPPAGGPSRASAKAAPDPERAKWAKLLKDKGDTAVATEAFAQLKAKGITAADIKAWADDAGVLPEDGKVTAKIIWNWLDKNQDKHPGDWVAVLVERMAAAEPEPETPAAEVAVAPATAEVGLGENPEDEEGMEDDLAFDDD